MPDDVIQARAQMMDNLSSQDTETKRNLALLMVLKSFAIKLDIVLRDNWIFAVPEKSVDFAPKILDLHAGTLKFSANSCKGIVHIGLYKSEVQFAYEV